MRRGGRDRIILPVADGGRPPGSRRRGVLLLIIITFLVFTVIVFASLINRVRSESALTARNSINELMYQLATSVGELAIRRIGKDFELNVQDKDGKKMVEKILESIQTGQPLRDQNCTDKIKNLDVVKELKEKHFRQNDLDFAVSYSVEILPTPMPDLFRGLPAAKLERHGSLKVNVDVFYTHGKTYKKSYAVSKPFFVMFMLLAPFHRFTLFSPKGVDIDPKVANGIDIDDSGQLQGNKPPLVLINRRVGQNSAMLEFANHRNNFIPDQDALFKNGWVYLGGDGTKNNNEGLILNVAAGAKSDSQFPPDKCFGEFFHFFTDNQTKGWIPNSWWSQKYPNIFGDTQQTYVMFVDYGHFAAMYKSSGQLYQSMFKESVELYRKPDHLEQASSLHLFGTPRFCTPSLVFGRVYRRYMRTQALLHNPPSVPFVVKAKYLFSPGSLIQEFITKLSTQTGGSPGGTLSAEADRVNQTFFDPTTFQTLIPSPELAGMAPNVVDNEPYLLGLGNLCYPDAPAQGQDLSAVMRKQGLTRLSDFFGADPRRLKMCEPDFDLDFDTEIRYRGKFTDLNPDRCGLCGQTLPNNPSGGAANHRCRNASCKGTRYLRSRASYYVADGIPAGGNVVKWSSMKKAAESPLLHRFFANNGELYLNQIIAIKNKLVIDEAVTVLRGGVILCDDEIEINHPIKAAPPQTGNYFPFLTLVSAKGIRLNTNHVEAFLIASNGNNAQVENNCGRPIYIRGGVVSDNIESLVKNGGTIEYGMAPEDLGAGGNPVETDNPEFYGFALGPKTHEELLED